MANNSFVRGGRFESDIVSDKAGLARRREELREMLKKSSYPKLVKYFDLNSSYLWGFIEEGIVPKNKDACKKMGIVVVSKGAARYRALSEKARAKGWTGLSEALTALDNGEWELPEKGDVI